MPEVEAASGHRILTRVFWGHNTAREIFHSLEWDPISACCYGEIRVPDSPEWKVYQMRDDRPGGSTDDVVMTLATLGRKPPQDDTLSYVWCSGTRKVLILARVSGREDYYRYAIKVSLRHLPHQDRPPSLRIYAICSRWWDSTGRTPEPRSWTTYAA